MRYYITTISRGGSHKLTKYRGSKYYELFQWSDSQRRNNGINNGIAIKSTAV